MAISATITEYDGQTVDVTISEGVGPAGPEGPAGSVTNADINAAIATDPAASRSAMVVAEIKEVTLSTTPGDGAANVAAIQAALDNFSHVRLIGPGVAEVTDSVIVYANQTLEGDADLQLKKVGHFGAVIINEAAFTAGALDENITLRGIRIDADLTQGRGIPVIGMNGHISLCRVKNALVEDCHVIDAGSSVFSFHASEWEWVTLRNCSGTGNKGTCQFQTGHHARVEDCSFEALDDALAFNAADYWQVMTAIGDISDVVITGCTDATWDDGDQHGNFIRLVTGGWSDWTSARDYTTNSIVTNAGHVYVCVNPSGTRTAANAPTHTGWLSTGNEVTGADGIIWRYLNPVPAKGNIVEVEGVIVRDCTTEYKSNRAMFRTTDSTETSFADNVDGNRGWARDILLDGIIQKPSDGVTTATVLSIGGAFERMTVRNCYSEKPGYFIGASSDVTGRTDTCDLLVDGFRLGENPTRMLDLQESGKVLNLSLVNTQWPGGTIVRNLTGGTLRTVDCDIPFLLTDVTSKEVGDKLKQTTGWREWSGTQWRALGFDPLSEGYRCRRLTWFQPSGPTWSSGTGATTSLAIPEEGRADCGTALSGYAKLFAQTGVSGFSAFSGAAWSFETAGAVEVSAALVVSSNAASRARLMVGVENTRVSPLADSDALSANGLGLEIRRTASQWEARLVSYSSSTFTASSWAQIQSNVSSTMRSLRIDWDGLGNATLRASTVGGSRGTRALASTPIATLTGTVPTTAAGRGVMWEVVNPASGTAANFQTQVLPINFVTEPN